MYPLVDLEILFIFGGVVTQLASPYFLPMSLYMFSEVSLKEEGFPTLGFTTEKRFYLPVTNMVGVTVTLESKTFWAEVT